MLNFCTLFDINFAVQGITMYESLRAHCRDFHLYIFAFCDECLALLQRLDLADATVISMAEFEDPELLKVKPTRSRGEYCWTCSSSAILYCLEHFHLDHCIYIDADLYFYDDPYPLVAEMGDKAVLLTEHRFPDSYSHMLPYGKYCVQFIMFRNNPQGMAALRWWRTACIDWCFDRLEDGKFGDQKYLDDWIERFAGVHVLAHLGGGAAPWNLIQYDVFVADNILKICKKNTVVSFPMIFYHFQDVYFLSSGKLYLHREYEITLKQQNLLYSKYFKSLRAVSRKLHRLDAKVAVVSLPWLPYTWQQVRRWLFRCRWPKKNSGAGGYLIICGRTIWSGR